MERGKPVKHAGLAIVLLAGVVSVHADDIVEPEDIAAIRASASLGDTAAQMTLGEMFYEGKNVPKSNAKAVLWYLMAAEHGEAKAQTIVGLFYLAGDGVRQDVALGEKWLHRASAQGDPTAQRQLELMKQKATGE